MLRTFLRKSESSCHDSFSACSLHPKGITKYLSLLSSGWDSESVSSPKLVDKLGVEVKLFTLFLKILDLLFGHKWVIFTVAA